MNFNLLVTTSRFNEENAGSELWFLLLACGDPYPIISNTEYSGVITALTELNPRDVISEINGFISINPEFLQYILKIVPIDFVCETNVSVINEIIQSKIDQFLKNDESFRILLKRRKNELINRDQFIDKVARNIHNEVDLENPDKILRIESLGKFCGIGLLKPGEIIRSPARPSS